MKRRSSYRIGWVVGEPGPIERRLESVEARLERQLGGVLRNRGAFRGAKVNRLGIWLHFDWSSRKTSGRHVTRVVRYDDGDRSLWVHLHALGAKARRMSTAGLVDDLVRTVLSVLVVRGKEYGLAVAGLQETLRALTRQRSATAFPGALGGADSLKALFEPAPGWDVELLVPQRRGDRERSLAMMRELGNALEAELASSGCGRLDTREVGDGGVSFIMTGSRHGPIVAAARKATRGRGLPRGSVFTILRAESDIVVRTLPAS